FAERLFAAMALHREMRYDEAMAELEMLVGFDATNTQARDLLQQTQQRHAEVMEGTRRARAAVAAGDLERAHDAYRALQERVPLHHETVAEGRRVAEALHARQEMRELLAEGDLDGAQRAADAV